MRATTRARPPPHHEDTKNTEITKGAYVVKAIFVSFVVFVPS
jgi:hypothetical protein